MVKKVLITVIAISLLVACYTAFNRYKVEQRNNHVEIAIDMNEFQNLAGQTGENFEDLAKRLQNSGATSIGVQEATLNDFKDRGYIAFMSLGDFMMGAYSTGNVMPASEKLISTYKKEISTLLKSKNVNSKALSYYSVVITPYKDVFDFLKERLAKRVKIDAIESEDSYVIILKQELTSMGDSGLGFYAKDFEFAKKLKFINVIPRMQNYQGITEKDIDDKIADVKKFGATTVIFAGNSVLGYTGDEQNEMKLLKYAAKKFQQNGLVTAIIEKPADQDVEKGQHGIKMFSKESGYTSTKVFSIDMDKQKTYNPKDIIDQWARAISERNARIIYVKPIANPDKNSLQNLEDTSLAVSMLAKRVSAMGFLNKISVSINDTKPSMVERLIIITGIIAASLLLLLGFFEINSYVIYGLLSVGALGTAGVLFSTTLYNILGDMGIKVAALVCAIVFPSLASWYLISLFKKYSDTDKKMNLSSIIRKSIVTLLSAAFIALAGGIMVAALLAESKYLLKLDIFRGVKIAFVSPMIIFIILYIKHIGIYSDTDGNPISIPLQLKKLMNTSVTVKYVIAGVIVLAAIIILLLRSGNAPANMTSGAELSFRATLENMLIARPRSKELLTFPILMLLTYTLMRQNRVLAFLSIFAAVVGLSDIVNSFSHIRMPIQISALSTSYSVLFAIVAGTVLIILINMIEKKFQANTK